MRTTIELPDELLSQAKILAAVSGISLRQFFIEAVQQKVSPPVLKVRRPPPCVGNPDPTAPRINVTREQIDEALFG